MLDLIIRNGSVCSGTGIRAVDIGVSDGKIAILADRLSVEAAEIVDAKGCYVLPGIIDVHTHIDHWGGTANTEDTFFTGSRAAAFGGTTTFIDFAVQRPDENVRTAVTRRISQIQDESCIDYGIHAHVTDSSDTTVNLIHDLIHEGFTSFKMFTTYKAAGFKIEDPDMLTLMKEITRYGGFCMVHAENDSFCEELTGRLLAKDMANVRHYAGSRPAMAEIECISRLLLFAKMTGAKLYIVHVTTAESVELIRQAKREGVDVTAETCTHYLILDESCYTRDDGYKYVMAPPLRTKRDIEALWSGLLDGTLSIVSSDHCDYSTDKKIDAKTNFTKISPGLHGIEWLGPLMYEHAVVRRGIRIEKVVGWLSENPAKVFGIADRKGKIDIGMDADMIVFDPKSEQIMGDHDHHMSSDFCPYKDEKLTGKPIKIYSKGQLIVDGDQFLGGKGKGALLLDVK
ncbi:MAG: dihydropyrimidinase [Sporolactobacillus sp.]|uniref:Dihydropyrimidinase n=1 Tax=Sporolactobacillus nakayamae TaxID=269670 RepID=A0A1I2QVY6_9BACL|nr:dihydropyrimidinase [Sporolactobacillus nakayamae]SFG32735.1 dihydropyrimidinase [Sporolactobacillus nakayamae]